PLVHLLLLSFPSRRSSDLAVFLIARPPLLAVMQRGDYRLISIHSHVHRPALQPHTLGCVFAVMTSMLANKFQDGTVEHFRLLPIDRKSTRLNPVTRSPRMP